MQYRKFVFISLFVAILIVGCEARYETETSRDGLQNISKANLTSSFRASAEKGNEINNIIEPEGILTLRRALALTLMNNPELKVFSLETRAAQARALQAGLWPNPEIEVEVENIGGTGEFNDFDAAETTIQLSQLIETGRKSQKREKIASFEKTLADLDYQNKKLEIFSEASNAFIEVLKAQEKLKLSNELLKLSEESFQTVEKIVNAGKDSPIEKIRASVALSKIELLYFEAQRNLEYSRKRLVSFWGQDEPLFERVEGDFASIEQLPGLENLTGRLKLNLQLARWGTEIRKNQAKLDLEKSRAVGDITIGGGYKRFSETNDDAFVFGFSIPLPVSDRNQGAKQEAVYNLAKSKQEQKAAWLKLMNELNHLYQELANSYSQTKSLKNEILPGAIEMFDAAVRAYQEGKVDYLNVLDAQRTLFDVKNEYIESLAAYHTTRIDIERLIGREIENVNISESE